MKENTKGKLWGVAIHNDMKIEFLSLRRFFGEYFHDFLQLQLKSGCSKMTSRFFLEF